MRNSILLVLCVLLIVCFAALPATGQGEAQNKFQVIKIMRFQVQEGIDFPADYMAAMMEDLPRELEKSGNFQQVLREGENPTQADASVLCLTGTVTEFKKGSRAARWAVPGVGTTKVKAHVKFQDCAAAGTLHEADVDGKVVMGGAVKGESIGATRGLAKEVAKVAKQKFPQPAAKG